MTYNLSDGLVKELLEAIDEAVDSLKAVEENDDAQYCAGRLRAVGNVLRAETSTDVELPPGLVEQARARNGGI